MILIRCTRRLARFFGVERREPEEASRAVLGEWYANLVPVTGGPVVLFVNSPTRLAVVVPAGERRKVENAFALRVPGLYRRLGLPAASVRAESAEFGRYAYARTSSRSVLGSMSDLAGHMREAVLGLYPGFGARATAFELAASRMPHSPLGARLPADVARELVAASGARAG